MNNIAYAQGMTPLFSHSYYVGTFGEYDLNAIRRALSGKIMASTGTGPVGSKSK